MAPIQILANELIEMNDVQGLISLRADLTKWVPKELCYREEAEACDMIDNFLNAQ
jgi:hypothetical protein